MTAAERGYLAGIVDGEGCLGVYRGKTCLVPRITVRMTHEPTIRLLHRHLGGHVGCYTKVKGNRKPQWYWNASSQKAAAAVRLVQAHLRIKKPQAKLILELAALLHANNGSNRPGHVTERQAEIEKELHRLNRKGIS